MTADDKAPQASLGFYHGHKFSWVEYVKYRPAYPSSLYSHIYAHHRTVHPDNCFGTAHDAGAGSGIVAEQLAKHFTKVMVSDPNMDYLQMAAQRLASLPEMYPPGRFTYLNEGSEHASIENGSVDLITMCEAIHWSHIPTTIVEFARQLRKGGTLFLLHYSPCRIVDNDMVQKIWNSIFEDVEHSAVNDPEKEVYRRAGRQIATGFDNVWFDEEVWEKVERKLINTRGNRRDICLSTNCTIEGEDDRVGKHDIREFSENDPEWSREGCDVDWLKQVFANFLPAVTVPDVENKFKEMEQILADGTVKVIWPNVQIMATKR